MERKLATVLFVDLVDSTQFASGEDPEIVRRRIQTFFQHTSACIEQHGGTVEKFAGDAVMAVFGAPAAQEDHTERALKAAVSMRRRLEKLFGARFRLRIGVNTGEVVVGLPRVGSSFASGDAVNVAARLEQAAAPGEILVSQTVRDLVAGSGLEFEERDTVEVIDAMDRICIEAEQTQPLNLEQDFLNRVFTRVDQSIAMAALFTAYHLKVKAIASLTESGSTALWMSRLNCGVPIYALTSQTPTRYRCALFRDVFPLMVKYVGHDREELLHEAEKVLVDNKVVKEGDLIVLTIGEPIGKAGGTNTMKIVKVGEHLKP